VQAYIPVSEVFPRLHLWSVIYYLSDVVNCLFHRPRVYFWKQCFSCRWTSSPEFTAWWPAWFSCWIRTFSTSLTGSILLLRLLKTGNIY